MNKIYEAPELVITTLGKEDILTVSPGDTEIFDIDIW